MASSVVIWNDCTHVSIGQVWCESSALLVEVSVSEVLEAEHLTRIKASW